MVGDVFAACDEMFMRAPRFFPSYRIAIAADNDNNIGAIDPHAMPVNRNWRSTRAGLIAQKLAPVLVIVGATLTVAWSAMLSWVVFQIFGLEAMSGVS